MQSAFIIIQLYSASPVSVWLSWLPVLAAMPCKKEDKDVTRLRLEIGKQTRAFKFSENDTMKTIENRCFIHGEVGPSFSLGITCKKPNLLESDPLNSPNLWLALKNDVYSDRTLRRDTPATNHPPSCAKMLPLLGTCCAASATEPSGYWSSSTRVSCWLAPSQKS